MTRSLRVPRCSRGTPSWSTSKSWPISSSQQSVRGLHAIIVQSPISVPTANPRETFAANPTPRTHRQLITATGAVLQTATPWPATTAGSTARAGARERAWGLGVRRDRIAIDIDATLVNAHTEKEGAAVNYRSGFGFHPMLAYLDESPEALAGVLRGGGAPADSAQAQIDVLDLALAQLPVDVMSDLDTEIVMRIDSAGAAGALCQTAQDANIAFLVGFDLFTGVRESILQLPEDAWRPALRLLVIAAADPLGEGQQLLRRPRPRTRRPARQGSMTTDR
jgi:Transposase DDE domain group 1